jgi:uncharacterized protein
MPTWLKLGLVPPALLAMLYALALGWLYWRQERLLFQPDVLPPGHRFELAADVQELRIEVPGASLSALHLRLPQPRGLVFFLHGNGGSLASWFVNLDFYRQAGFDLFMLDYRGYGKSSGQIESEAQLRADVMAAWQQIAPRYAGLPRVIYGRSLGSALATGLAAEQQPELTVLVSPYRSMGALTAEHYPFAPEALLRYPLASELDLPRIKGPVLLIHGEQDRLIEPRHSQALLPLARQGRLVLIPEAAHNDIDQFALYRETFRRALDQL